LTNITTICCNHPCMYEDEGICTLTYVTSVTEINNKDCAYFRNKKEPNPSKNTSKKV